MGKNGVTDSVLFSLNEALTAREIVKIKVLKNCLEETKSVGLVLSEKTESELVQVVGRNIVLYKPNKEKPEIILPE